MKALVAAALVVVALSLRPPPTAIACSGDAFDALARAKIVFVGELVSVTRADQRGAVTTFVRAHVQRYLKGIGPSDVLFTEDALNQCSSGIRPEDAGSVGVFGLEQDRGRLVLPKFAFTTLDDERVVVNRLAEARAPAAAPMLLRRMPSDDPGAGCQMLALAALLTLAAAARTVTARYSVSTS